MNTLKTVINVLPDDPPHTRTINIYDHFFLTFMRVDINTGR